MGKHTLHTEEESLSMYLSEGRGEAAEGTEGLGCIRSDRYAPTCSSSSPSRSWIFWAFSCWYRPCS